MAVLPLRKPPPAITAPSPSPERAKLAEKITNRDQALARLAALIAILERGQENVFDARRAVDAAADAIKNARAIDARAAASALIAGEAQPKPTAAVARVTLEEAEATLAAALFARDSVQVEIAELTSRAGLRASVAEDAASAVIKSEAGDVVSALIVEAEAAFIKAADAGLALAWLASHGVIAARGPDAMPGLSSLLNRISNMGIDWDYVRRPDASPAVPAWRATFAALIADADAASVPK